MLESWTTGDFETTRSLLTDDVTFLGPLGHTEGADDYVEGVKGLATIVKAAEPLKVVAEGSDVCIIYDLVTTTPEARIPTVGWYQIRDGKVAALRVFFDPRPLIS
jgi:hypothetical protein